MFVWHFDREGETFPECFVIMFWKSYIHLINLSEVENKSMFDYVSCIA